MTRSLLIATALFALAATSNAHAAGGCPKWMCGDNGLSLNGLSLNGRDLQGRYLNGIQVIGAAPSEKLAVGTVILPTGETVDLHSRSPSWPNLR
jgi:hypothetical protein